MAAYPQDPFKQADSLLTGLIESYRGSTDAPDIADIQSLVETTVKIARDREYRIHTEVKGVQPRDISGGSLCVKSSYTCVLGHAEGKTLTNCWLYTGTGCCCLHSACYTTAWSAYATAYDSSGRV